MIPRLRLDIGWSELGYAAWACAAPGERAEAEAVVEALVGPEAVVCLSVRSGLDAFLEAGGWGEGQEALITGVTIPHMAELLRRRGLRVVPVEVDPATMAPLPGALEAAWSPRAAVLVVAHLFGARLELGACVAFAKARGLALFEDCAQAFAGDGWWGHPEATVSAFSFGMIKSATALGGGVLVVRDAVLRAGLRAVRDAQPIQPTAEHLQRLGRAAVLKLAGAPPLLGALHALASCGGWELDRALNEAARGFRGGELCERLRRRPSAALLRLMARRLRSAAPDRYAARGRCGAAALARLPPGLEVLGREAPRHTHWVFPLVAPGEPLAAIAALRRAGFDATCGSSSLHALDPGLGVASSMGRVVYVPLDPALDEAGWRRLFAALHTLALEVL